MQSQPVNAGRGRGGAPGQSAATRTSRRQRMQFFAREGVVAVLEPGNGRNDHGAIVVQGPNQNRDPKEPPTPRRLSWPASTTTASRGCSSTTCR